jgi:hypothetical protein
LPSFSPFEKPGNVEVFHPNPSASVEKGYLFAARYMRPELRAGSPRTAQTGRNEQGVAILHRWNRGLILPHQSVVSVGAKLYFSATLLQAKIRAEQLARRVDCR